MFIYKITNKINGKIYIGQTIQSINKRWIKHLSDSKCKDYAISRALRKYSKEDFIVEEIDGANSQSELNYKEWLYIYKFNSLAPNGYNSTTGGKVSKHNKEGRLKISNALKGREFTKTHRKNLSEIRKKRVFCETNGKVYSSIKKAAKELLLDESNIVRVCRNKQKKHKGYVFKYIEE